MKKNLEKIIIIPHFKRFCIEYGEDIFEVSFKPKINYYKILQYK